MRPSLVLLYKKSKKNTFFLIFKIYFLNLNRIKPNPTHFNIVNPTLLSKKPNRPNPPYFYFQRTNKHIQKPNINPTTLQNQNQNFNPNLNIQPNPPILLSSFLSHRLPYFLSSSLPSLPFPSP